MNYIVAAEKYKKKIRNNNNHQLLYLMEIAALQKIVKDRYFATDNARGIYHTALWFHEEVGELSSAIANGNIENAKEEFADVLMWMLTLANILNIDMEESIATYLDNPEKMPSK